MTELKDVLGSAADITIFRKLAELSYQTSYSHRGRYYTLADIPQYDAWGLWSYRSVWCSRRGTLLATAEALVQEADAGFFVAELEGVLNVEVKGALLRLVRQQKLARASFAGRYLYCSPDTATRDAQLTARRVRDAATPLGGRLPHVDVLPDELKASIVLFFSLLDEQQRRLYAGLESLKMGPRRRPGDRRPAGAGRGDRGPRAAPHPGPRCDCRACPPGWRRTPTGGKKTPAVIARIDELMTHETAGDPMSGLKWTRRTTEKIAAELQSLGISVGPRTVARLLTQLGFSLRVNQKKRSTGSPARRNEQFEQIASLRERFVTDAAPIEIMFQYEKILNAIRKDLGHKNQGFKRGTLLGMWVNDIDSHV